MTHTVTVKSGDKTQIGWRIYYCEATGGTPPESSYELVTFKKSGDKFVGSVTLVAGKTWIIRCNVELTYEIEVSLSPGETLISPWQGEWPIAVKGKNKDFIYVLVGGGA